MTEATHYPSIVPYLMVGDAPRMIEFLTKGFGGTARMAMTDEAGRINHAEIALGDGLLMLSQTPDGQNQPISLCLYVPDTDAVFARAVAAGAQVQSVPADQDYGQRMAGITDPAGNTWWICSVLD